MKLVFFLVLLIALYPSAASVMGLSWKAGESRAMPMSSVFYVVVNPDGNQSQLEVVPISELGRFGESNPELSFTDIPEVGTLHIDQFERTVKYSSVRQEENQLLVQTNWRDNDGSGENRYQVKRREVTPISQSLNQAMTMLFAGLAAAAAAFVGALIAAPLAMKGLEVSGLLTWWIDLTKPLRLSPSNLRTAKLMLRLSTGIYLWPVYGVFGLLFSNPADVTGFMVIGTIVILPIAALVRGVFLFQRNAVILHGLVAALIVFKLVQIAT